MSPDLVEGGNTRWVLTTCPDGEIARGVSETLVGERLAACSSIVPGLTSIYWWEGAVESASECLLMLKTTATRLDALAQRLHEIHPYDVPEFLTFPVDLGSREYLRWVEEETER
jgi:periplasmic divalent cation tolerance protein